MDRLEHSGSCSLAFLWDMVPEGTLCSCYRGVLDRVLEGLQPPSFEDELAATMLRLMKEPLLRSLPRLW